MRKAISSLIIFFLVVVLAGCSLPGGKEKEGAIQVNSVPSGTVFLDGKHVGRTPHLDEKVPAGEYILKIVSEIEGGKSAVWSGKIKITSGTLTLVNRELSDIKDETAGEVLTLEPITDKSDAQLAIVTNVDGVTVKMNEEFKGTTPLVLKDLKEGSYKVALSFPGYIERRIDFKLAEGYRLTIEADLAKSEVEKKEKEEKKEEKEEEATPSGEEAEEKKEEGKFKIGTKVIIKETGTGWLRVRIEPSLAASEAAKIDVGNEFEVLESVEGWVKIEYEDGSEGWVSDQYLQEVKEED